MKDAKYIQKKMDSIGNITIIFEPTGFIENRLTGEQLESTLNDCQISLRGWNFPHIPTRTDRDGTAAPYSINKGIEFYTDWSYITEIFRFYFSGQFCANLALKEDLIEAANGRKIPANQYVDFLGLILTITEAVLFIKNLCEKLDIDGGTLLIEINNTMNRQLESLFNSSISWLDNSYICRMEKVTCKKEVTKEKLMNEPLDVAREFIVSIFFAFNWKNPSPQMILTHQEKLLNRTL